MRATPEGGFVHNDESDELTAAPTRLFLSSSFFFFWRGGIQSFGLLPQPNCQTLFWTV